MALSEQVIEANDIDSALQGQIKKAQQDIAQADYTLMTLHKQIEELTASKQTVQGALLYAQSLQKQLKEGNIVREKKPDPIENTKTDDDDTSEDN